MTVVTLHPDSASLEYHMEVAGPRFRRFVELLTLSSIQIYGDPSEKVLTQAHEKARLLGCGIVAVEPLHAGFARVAETAGQGRPHGGVASAYRRTLWFSREAPAFAPGDRRRAQRCR